MPSRSNRSVCADVIPDKASDELAPLFLFMCYFIMCISYVIVPCCVAYFVYYRQNFQRLTRRNLFLLVCFAIGVLMHNTNSFLRFIIGPSKYPCHALLLLGYTTNAFLLRSQVFRLFGLFWRINFNKSLIDATFRAAASGTLVVMPGQESFITIDSEMGEAKNPNNIALREIEKDRHELREYFGSSRRVRDKKIVGSSALCIAPCLYTLFCWEKFSELPPDLHFQQFLAAPQQIHKFYIAYELIELPLIFLVHFQIIPFEANCGGCSPDNVDPIIDYYFITTAIFGIAIVYLLRKDRDSLGIKKEIYLIVLIFIISLLLKIPVATLVPDVEEKGIYTVSINDAIAALLVVFLSFPYQVFKARSVDRRNKLHDEDSLDEVLSDNEATRAFALYLASHLSIENLLFYRVVQNWKSDFPKRSNGIALQQARIIVAQFVDTEADFMINISFNLRESLMNAINGDSIKDDFFDTAKNAVYVLMNEQMISFRKSSYYKAHNKQIGSVYDEML